MQQDTKAVWAREWIIFALSIGLGGHVALGVVLHDPSPRQWQDIGWNVVFFGLCIYILFQGGRSLFLFLRSRRATRPHR
jgi:hypothetical protein